VITAHRVPAEARGRAFAVNGSAVQGAGMAGLLLGGVLVDRFDPRMLVAAAGIAGLVAVVACIPPVRRTVRRERAAAALADLRDGSEKGQSAATGRTVPVGDSVGS
jgi:MFS family permease